MDFKREEEKVPAKIEILYCVEWENFVMEK